MKTKSGITMMTAAEIIKGLKDYPPNEVVVFEQMDTTMGEISFSVLRSLQRLDSARKWDDDGEGNVTFRDEKGEKLFTIKKE